MGEEIAPWRYNTLSPQRTRGIDVFILGNRMGESKTKD